MGKRPSESKNWACPHCGAGCYKARVSTFGPMGLHCPNCRCVFDSDLIVCSPAVTCGQGYRDWLIQEERRAK